MCHRPVSLKREAGIAFNCTNTTVLTTVLYSTVYPLILCTVYIVDRSVRRKRYTLNTFTHCKSYTLTRAIRYTTHNHGPCGRHIRVGHSKDESARTRAMQYRRNCTVSMPLSCILIDSACGLVRAPSLQPRHVHREAIRGIALGRAMVPPARSLREGSGSDRLQSPTPALAFGAASPRGPTPRKPRTA